MRHNPELAVSDCAECNGSCDGCASEASSVATRHHEQRPGETSVAIANGGPTLASDTNQDFGWPPILAFWGSSESDSSGGGFPGRGNEDWLREPGFPDLLDGSSGGRGRRRRDWLSYAPGEIPHYYAVQDEVPEALEGRTGCWCPLWSGHVSIDDDCKGISTAWIIPEWGNKATGAVAGESYNADGFTTDGADGTRKTVKVPNGVCVHIKCKPSRHWWVYCTNDYAQSKGKKPEFKDPGEFGGPPKEPPAGVAPPRA